MSKSNFAFFNLKISKLSLFQRPLLQSLPHVTQVFQSLLIKISGSKHQETPSQPISVTANQLVCLSSKSVISIIPALFIIELIEQSIYVYVVLLIIRNNPIKNIITTKNTHIVAIHISNAVYIFLLNSQIKQNITGTIINNACNRPSIFLLYNIIIFLLLFLFEVISFNLSLKQ